MDKYRVTKEQCDAGLSGVCSRCGKPVVSIETVDNARNPTHWSGCDACMCFDNGVTEEVYRIAKSLVQDHFYTHYSHLSEDDSDSADMKIYKQQQQISGACGVVMRVLDLKSLTP